MPEPSLFAPADTALDIVIDNVLHEVRRALVRPIYQIHKGDAALCQGAALSWGWLAKVEKQPALLVPTMAGRTALAEHLRHRHV